MAALLIGAAPARATLDVAIEAGPDPAQPGEVVEVAITVTNPGGTASGPVTLRMVYPAGLASVSELYISDSGGCPGTSCEVTETLDWFLPALGPGEGTTVTMAPTVASSAVDGSTILFDVDALEGGSFAATSQKQIDVTASRFFDLAVDESREPASTGSVLVYEITYGNRSAETSTDTELTFIPAPGTVFSTASGGGVLVGGTVRWDLGTLAGRQGGRETVSVVVGAGQGPGAILDRARVAIEGDGDFTSHRSDIDAVTRIENGSRLIVGMVLNPDPAVQGEALRAAIQVTNPGPSFADDVRLKLRFPKSLQSHSELYISDGGGCAGTSCEVREELFWNLGDLPPGGGVTVTLAPSIATVAGGTVVSFPVAADAAGQSRTLTRQSLIVRDSRLFDLAVDAERSPASSSAALTYTLTYGNRSTETTTSTSLFFPLPGGTTFVSASDGGVLAGGAVVWNLGTLVGRQGGQRQVKVDVGPLIDGAPLVVDPARLIGQGDFLTHETRARAVGRIENDTRLDVAITVDRDPVVPSERTSLRATVTNRSAIDFANNVVLRWRHPTGVSSVSDGANMLGGDCAGTSCEPRELAFFSLGTLPPGGGAVVEWSPEVSGSAPSGSVISHPVEVDASDRSRIVASHSVLVRETRALDLAVDSDLDPVDGTVVYELTYGNRGDGATTGSRLVFPVPDGLTATGASDGGTLETGGDLPGPSVVWNLGTLAARETGRRKVRLATGGTPEGELSRVFDAEIEGQGAFFREVTRSRDARRIEDVSRTLRLSATPQPVFPNAMLDTTLDIVNTAPSFLFDTTLRLRYPEGLFSLGEGAISDGGDCPGTSCEEAEILFWDLGDLNPGQAVDVTLPPTVSSGRPEGSLVRYWARLDAGSFGQAAASKAIPVGDDFTDAGPIQFLGLFFDDFESGDTSAWSAVSP